MGSKPTTGTTPKNPRRVTAGQANRAKRGPLTPEARERLRVAALANRPWVFSTGPKTAEGKQKAARNGKVRQLGDASVREIRRELADLHGLVAGWRSDRKAAHR